jgi:tetratricopeptide (TPR) repeat protein
LKIDDNSDVLEEVTRNRGIALVEMERYQEARPLLNASRTVTYHRERTLCSLGITDFALKNFDAAQLDFEELLALAPSSVFQAYAHYYLGKIFCRRGQLARAKSALEECLACPERGEVSEKILLQGLIYCSRGLNLSGDANRYSEMLKTLR